MRLLPVGPGDGRCGAARGQRQAERRRHRRGDERQHLPLRYLPAHPCGDQARRKELGMITNESRRLFLKASGSLVLGAYLPEMLAQSGPGKTLGASAASTFEPNAFVRIGADNTVTVIVKHLEMGQGT